MERNIKTFNQIGSMAFAGESSSNNALLFLTTIKDAITAAKGGKIAPGSYHRFDQILPVLDLACSQADQNEENDSQMEEIKFHLDDLVESIGGGKYPLLYGALDILFRSYLSVADSNDAESRTRMYEFVMILKSIFECHSQMK